MYNQYNTGLNTVQQLFNNANTTAGAQGNFYNQMANLYNGALDKQTNIAQQQFANILGANNANLNTWNSVLSGSTMPLSTAAAAQEATLYAPLALYNTGLGLNSANTGALQALAGYGTTKTTTSGGGGGFWGGLLGNAVSAIPKFL